MISFSFLKALSEFVPFLVIFSCLLEDCKTLLSFALNFPSFLLWNNVHYKMGLIVLFCSSFDISAEQIESEASVKEPPLSSV